MFGKGRYKMNEEFFKEFERILKEDRIEREKQQDKFLTLFSQITGNIDLYNARILADQLSDHSDASRSLASALNDHSENLRRHSKSISDHGDNLEMYVRSMRR